MAKYTSYNFGNGCIKPARGLSWTLTKRSYYSATYIVMWWKKQKEADEHAAFCRANGFEVISYGYNPNVLWDDVIDTKVFMFNSYSDAHKHTSQWKP